MGIINFFILKPITLNMKVLAALASLALFAAPVLGGGDSVEIWNTFQEEETTGGLEARYEVRTTTIDEGVTLFPVNPPGKPEGGFYNISMDFDGKDGTVTWLLSDNLGAGHLEFDEGSYDRYYLIFEFSLASASLVSSDDIVVETGIFAYRDDTTSDVFPNGLVFPEVLDDKTLYMFVKPGTNLTTLGQEIIVNVEKKMKKAPSLLEWLEGILDAIGL